MGAICVMPLPGSESLDLESVVIGLEAVMRRDVVVSDVARRCEFAYDASRDQYNSRQLLAMLDEACPPVAERIVGVASFDLFIPVLTFVFGEAQLEGRAAVVSSMRLDTRFYGLPGDPERLHARLLTEMVHELGHTYGMRHCDVPRCAMNRSTYVEEIDLKDSHYCGGCARHLLG